MQYERDRVTRQLRNSGGTMAALALATKAPEFDLKTLDGKRFSLNDELARGPVVLVFFKISCPTCQYALPFFERLHQAYGHQGVTLVGISQNDAKETTAFNKEFERAARLAQEYNFRFNNLRLREFDGSHLTLP